MHSLKEKKKGEPTQKSTIYFSSSNIAMSDERNEVTFEIREHIGVISDYPTGWTKELNLVSWNNAETAKFDIRDWNDDHTHMSRGTTLHEDEAKRLMELLDKKFS